MSKRSCRNCQNGAHSFQSEGTTLRWRPWHPKHEFFCLKLHQPIQDVDNRVMKAAAKNCPDFVGGYWLSFDNKNRKNYQKREDQVKKYELLKVLYE